MLRSAPVFRRVFVGSLSWLSVALAQTAPGPTARPPSPAPTTPAPATTPVAGTPAAVSPSVAVPPPAPDDVFVPVDDPMLAPTLRAEKNVGSWQEALRIVRTRSSDLRLALTEIEAARGRARVELADSLPRLNGTGTLTHQLIMNDDVATGGFPFPPTVFTARADLIVPLLSARNWYDYATAKDEIRKVELDQKEAERRVIAGLAESIVAVITAERLSEVTRVTLSSALSMVALNERRAALGAGNALDVLRAEQEVARSRANVVESDEALRRSREALGQALGYDEPWGVPPEINLDSLQKDARATCTLEKDVSARADLRAAAAAEKIAERRATSVDYAFLPTLSAQSSLIYSTNNFATGSRGPVAWSIGGVLSWALYDGGARYGERHTNEALLEATRERARLLRRQAEIQVTQSHRGVEVAEQRLAVARASQALSAESARLARVKFTNGSGTSFDMIDTQRTARESEIDVTVKEFELLRAQIIAFLALASCDI